MRKIALFGIFAMTMFIGSCYIRANSGTGVICASVKAIPTEVGTKGVLKSLTPYGPYLVGPLVAICTALLYFIR
jgi:hypothetical protein